MGNASSGNTSTAGQGDRNAQQTVRQVALVLGFRGDESSSCTGRTALEERESHLSKLEGETLKALVQALLALTLPRDGKKVNQKCFRYARAGTRMEYFEYELSDERDRAAAAAACALDSRITQIKPSLVPSEMTESDYFRNYFTHVSALREWAFGDGATSGLPPPLLALGKARSKVNFFVGDKEYRTLSPELVKQQFSSTEQVAAFLASEPRKEQNDGARVSGTGNTGSDKVNARRKALLMTYMRLSQPTALSILLEIVTDDCRVLNDSFWLLAEQRVRALSSRTESFTQADLFIAPAAKYQTLFNTINSYAYDAKRDVKAVQAAWELDPKLSIAFQGFIPALLSKTDFWTHYFRHAMRCVADEYIHLDRR